MKYVTKLLLMLYAIGVINEIENRLLAMIIVLSTLFLMGLAYYEGLIEQ